MREGEELGRLRGVVARFIEAQQEALDATTRQLDSGGADPDDNVQLLETNERLEEALVDGRDILEGASDDMRGTLRDEGGMA